MRLLVYGGFTAVEAFALQLARVTGSVKVATAAGKGRGLVEGLGLTKAEIVDYRGEDVAGTVLEALVGERVELVFWMRFRAMEA